MDDTGLERLAEWLTGREAIDELAIAWPPGCKVTSHEDRPLMIPAPGIVGIVESYFEDGTIGVVAAMQQTRSSPITGVTVTAGSSIKAQCSPRSLVLLEYDVVTPEDMRAAIALRDSPLDS